MELSRRWEKGMFNILLKVIMTTVGFLYQGKYARLGQESTILSYVENF